MTATAAGVVEVERRIAAAPETVFSFFTDPERFARWFGGAELDPRPGGTFRTRVTGRTHMYARGEFVVVEPPTRVVFTWGWEPVDGIHHGLTEVPVGSTTVEVVLERDGAGGTILRLRHTDLPTDAACRFHDFGWDYTLTRLQAVAAGDDPGPSLLDEV